MGLRSLLKQIGLDDREAAVYLKMLASGPCSVRLISDAVSLNRPRVLAAIKTLEQMRLVSTFRRHKKELHQAEDPSRLIDALDARERGLSLTRRQMAELMPELKLLYAQHGTLRTARYFEGAKGASIVLNEILHDVSQLPEREYRVFSSNAVREMLDKEFRSFTKERVGRKIKVRVIGFGNERHHQPLTQYRWLDKAADAEAYIAVFGVKVAYISLNPANNQPKATIIENPALADTQRLVFEQLWERIG